MTDAKESTLQRLTAFNSQLEADAQRDRDAAMWRKVASMSICDLCELTELSSSTAEFIDRLNEQ